MFRSVTLTDFQSHESSHLPLGPFTVIVGSSSSGKSAVVRALRLVAENARGTTYVRQGAKSSRVALELSGSEPVLDSSTVVTVERGKSVSAYELRMPGAHGEPVIFTKCASNVPDAVSAALELGESKLWIAGQFDRPYLLDETGAEVARVLGKLTNVNMIYAAVRESNRRASESRRFHTARSQELSDALGQIGRYASLPARLAAGQRAEEALARAESLAVRRDQLARSVGDTRSSAERARHAFLDASAAQAPDVSRMSSLFEMHARIAAQIKDLRDARSRCVPVQVGPVPDTLKFDGPLVKRASLRKALQELSQAAGVVSRFAGQVRETREVAESAQARFADALSSAGSCPLCGASAAHAQIDHVV